MSSADILTMVIVVGVLAFVIGVPIITLERQANRVRAEGMKLLRDIEEVSRTLPPPKPKPAKQPIGRLIRCIDV